MALKGIVGPWGSVFFFLFPHNRAYYVGGFPAPCALSALPLAPSPESKAMGPLDHGLTEAPKTTEDVLQIFHYSKGKLTQQSSSHRDLFPLNCPGNLSILFWGNFGKGKQRHR
jgi:hypothetical protein